MTYVFIGTEANQWLTQRVLEYSIRVHAKSAVTIRPILQTHARVGGTNFGFVRFTLPSLMGFRGRAVYLDADQLVFRDIAELAAQLDDNHKVAVVTAAEGTFNDKPVAQHAQTSVMVLNTEKLVDWDPQTMFRRVVPNEAELKPGEIHYRDFMRLAWLPESDIQPLAPEWNHFNLVNERTKLVHFSYVRAQPWKNPKHPLTSLWTQWLLRAMEAGYVSRRELIREILLRHVHPYFISALWRRSAAEGLGPGATPLAVPGA